MSNKKETVILFGSKNSGKQQFYSFLTNTQEEKDLLSCLKPVSLYRLMDSQIFLFNIPEVDSCSDYSEIFLHSLSKYLHTFAYEVIQIACCIKFSDQIICEQEQYVSTLSKLFFNFHLKTITFIISEAPQSSEEKLNIYENSHYVFLSEQNKEYNQNLIKQYWKTVQDNNLILNQFEKLHTHQLFIKKYSEIQQSIFLEQFKKIQNMAEYLDFIDRFEEQPNQVAELSQIKEQINIFSELLFLIADLQDGLSSKSSDIFAKCRFQQYREDFFICSICSIVYSISRGKQYQIISSGKFVTTEKKIKNQKIDKCYECERPFGYQIARTYSDYIVSAIINKCIALYYSIKMSEDYVQLQSDIKQKTLTKLLQNQEDEANSSLHLETRNLRFQDDSNKNNQFPQQNNMVPTDKFHQEKISQQLIQNTLIKYNDSRQDIRKIVSLLISCENDEKSLIFSKLNCTQQFNKMKNNGQFRQSDLLRQKYCFIDSPSFSFSEEFQQTIALFKEFLNKNEIHFIFLFLDYQRIDLMKKNLTYMLQKLHKVDRQKMALVITNWQKHSEEDEINTIIELATQKKISKTILTNNHDQSLRVQKEIYSCLEDQNSDLISFAGTLFAEQAEEISEGIIDYKLLQLEKQIEDKYEKEQNEKLQDLKKQQNMLMKKREEYEKKIEQIDSLNLDLNLQIYNIENNIWKLNQAKVLQQWKQNSTFESVQTSYNLKHSEVINFFNS